MNRSLVKLDKNLGLEILILFFAFQRALISVSGVFSYLDELCAIIVTVRWLISVVRTQSIRRSEAIMVFAMMLLLLEGLCSNILSHVLDNKFAILIDIISIFKIFFFSLWILRVDCDADRIVRNLARVCRLIVYIMALCWVISQFVNIGMMYRQVRYGIRSYMFIFNNAGNYSKFFYFLIPLLAADLKYSITKGKLFAIGLACLMWILSMRSRAFSFVALFIVLAFMYFKKHEKKPGKIRWEYFGVLGAIALVFSWNQLVFYFTTDTQARSLLLRYSLVTLADYFPIGAGFGTYGSDVAAEYYSALYSKYDFSSIYGMGKTNTIYLNDNYWPMIFGQFGIIGTVLMVVILVVLHLYLYKKIKKERYFYFAGLCAMLFLGISSVASKSYCEFSSICVFLLLGVLARGASQNTPAPSLRNIE